eukprot:5242846-Amphidinium_carterae.1
MAVDKVKNIGGVERKLQRFISIFTPVNDYFDHLPEAWLPFFAFNETVPGWALGRPDLEVARPAMCVVPMGFRGSVSIIQSVSRRLVFSPELVGAHSASELSKQLPVPNISDGISVVYLDSFDYLRVVPKLASHLEKEESWEHKQFVK